ncbi:protein tyrosine phosphatase [Aliterella atlantica CENA595]|uniref:Protein tyrosine phosphatase n=2 Tax=Aliterella TaxID=1827277 RepID=A0A0D8ZP35_9CYAN|nr:protein tyrosine phosphatase [Aliterella atlantica CENA595]
MNYLVAQAHLASSITCDSVGTASYHIGSPPDRRMSTAAASKLGLKLLGQARQLQKSDLANFDLILAMDAENYRDILALDPSGQYKHKVHLMCEFCSKHTDKEVPDPYYGGPEGFNYVIDLLLDACSGLLTQIERASS